MNLQKVKDEFIKHIQDATAQLDNPIQLGKEDIVIMGCGEHKCPSKSKYEKDGCMYIYTFWCKEEERPLKIGKAGPYSHGRYSNHHYNSRSSVSCLANSLLNETEILKKWIGEDNLNKAKEQHNQKSSAIVRDAIKENCCRVDIKIKYDPVGIEGYDIFALEFIEGLLHYIYKPLFEGYNNQR